MKDIAEMVAKTKVNSVLAVLDANDEKCKVYLTKALQFDRYTQVCYTFILL